MSKIHAVQRPHNRLYLGVKDLKMVTIGSLITLTLATLLYLPHPHSHFARSCCLYTGAFIPYLFLAWCLSSGRVKALPRSALGFLCGVPFFTLMFAPPSLSEDVFRYLWEGHLWGTGINPYSTPPAEILVDDPFRQRVNHPELTAVYPPLLQIITASVMAASYSLVAWKLLLASVFAGGCWTIIQLLRSRGHIQERVLLFAWNPLVLVESSGMAHLDLLPAVTILLALLFWQRQRDSWLSFILASGASIKVFPILLVPLFSRGVTVKAHFTHGVSLLVCGAGLFIVSTLLLQAIAPFDSPLDLFKSLSLYAQSWEFNSPLYYGALSLSFPKWIVRCVLSGVTVVAVIACALTIRPESDRIKVCGWVIALWLVCSPVIHPWYIVSLAAFLPLLAPLSWVYLSWGAYLSYSVLPDYVEYKVWHESPEALVLVWVPFFLLTAYDLWKVAARKNPLSPLPLEAH